MFLAVFWFRIVPGFYIRSPHYQRIEIEDTEHVTSASYPSSRSQILANDALLPGFSGRGFVLLNGGQDLVSVIVRAHSGYDNSVKRWKAIIRECHSQQCFCALIITEIIRLLLLHHDKLRWQEKDGDKKCPCCG